MLTVVLAAGVAKNYEWQRELESDDEAEDVRVFIISNAEADRMRREQEGAYWPDGGDVSSCVYDHVCDCGVIVMPCPPRQLHTGQFELIGDDVEQQPENLGGASSSSDDMMEWAGGGAPAASAAHDDEKWVRDDENVECREAVCC